MATPIKIDVGARVHYTGDVANLPGHGNVIQVDESQWGVNVWVLLDAQVDQFDDDNSVPAREFVVSSTIFIPCSAQRWFTDDQWLAQKEQA